MSKNKLLRDRNSTLDPTIKALKSVCDHDFVKSSGLFYEELLSVINRLNDDSFRIAVVGEFSSGKSTFVNALIGRDLLKHGAKETTATITEIQNIKADENNESFDVFYADGNQEHDIPLDALEGYTTTSSNTHNVAQEISKVVIRSHVVDTSYPISFIDTPGLNGVADGHRELTIAQIRNAHACLYLLQVRGLGQSDVEFIRFISKYQHTFIFVQNFIDELNALEGESPEAKVQAQEKILAETVFHDMPDVNYKVIGISSRKALLARDDSITMDGEVVLSAQMKEKLLEESRFEDIIGEINTLIEQNKQNKMQQRDALFAAQKILSYLKDVILVRNEQDMEKWQGTPEARQKEKTKKLIELLQEKKTEYKKNIENFIESESDSLRKQCNGSIEKETENLKDSVYMQIDKIKDPDEFDLYARGAVSMELNNGVQVIESSVVNFLNVGFENLLDNALLRIKEYSGQSVENVGLKSFTMGSLSVKKQVFTQDETQIEVLQREIAHGRYENEKISQECKDIMSEQNELIKELETKRQEIVQKDSENRDAIRRIGPRPDKETKYREEEYEVFRGGLGILDAIFGPKRKTHTVQYLDSSKQEAWERERYDLDKKYRKDSEALNKQLNHLQAKIDEQKNSYSDLQEKKKLNNQSLKDNENLLEKYKEELDEKKKKAKHEYLAKLKSKLKERVQEYLYEKEDIKSQLLDEMDSMFESSKKSVRGTVLRMYEQSFKARIQQLEEGISSDEGNEKIMLGKDFEKQLKKTINIVEETICQM